MERRPSPSEESSEKWIERTDGASGAFIRELLRKAALFAADDGGNLVVEDRHLAEALHEIVVAGGELTRSLLGARGAKVGSSPPA